MAFNFNWSPLIADTERVRDMLTNALNKSPKPPIIVDDIVVNELNLGSTPPELEILEIGDLAEDRFRGIFKMTYAGDAYLTLKTRVQANPLNTYLSAKPTFASPQPLAANSSLTIPIQITLSDIRLSGFVILVFSKQKGITIVFRNDPLEALKVSSTFDSIPFVRNYLQKTIDSQLRVLFMEDLPAIIHRLSLRVFSSEYRTADDEALQRGDKSSAADPLHNPSQRAREDDQNMNDLLSPDPASETHASFSQKNLVRLAALIESQRTLSMFTPGIRESVYRAWATPSNREGSSSGTQTPSLQPLNLNRPHSSLHPPGMISSAASQASDTPSHATRPSMASMTSATTIHSLGSSVPSRSRPKKGRHRVINLRKKTREDKDHSDTVSLASSYDETISRSGSGSAESSSMARRTLDSESLRTPALSILREGEISTPPRSPPKRVVFHEGSVEGNVAMPQPSTPRDSLLANNDQSADPTPRPLPTQANARTVEPDPLPRMRSFPALSTLGEPQHIRRSSSELRLQNFVTAFSETSGGGILEQAWMMKMATEIARKVEEERSKSRRWQPSSDDGVTEGMDAPPAYVS